MQKEEGLTYREIAARDDVQKDLEKYSLLNKTELRLDTRVKEDGFFGNFYSAKTNLARFLGWAPKSETVKFLDRITADRESCAREYYDVNMRMRKQIMEKGAISRELQERKDKLGYKLYYLHSIMDVTIKEGVRLLNDKKITMEQWFQPMKELDKE